MAAIDHKDLSATDARQGVELGSVRWVLRISLGLAVVAGLVIYFTFLDSELAALLTGQGRSIS